MYLLLSLSSLVSLSQERQGTRDSDDDVDGKLNFLSHIPQEVSSRVLFCLGCCPSCCACDGIKCIAFIFLKSTGHAVSVNYPWRTIPASSTDVQWPRLQWTIMLSDRIDWLLLMLSLLIVGPDNTRHSLTTTSGRLIECTFRGAQ